MAGCDEKEDLPATQPVLSVLLEGVVAYVEVRSGHVNRSRGVKAELRKLGATIVESLKKDVTHVVFNEGLPSTYKKAKKFKCHLVSVPWIEACKDQLTIASEAAFPPIGQQIYENPQSLKNFRKMKSMQPDFDEEEDERKTNIILKRLQRRHLKKTQQLGSAVQNESELSHGSNSSSTNVKKKSKGPAKKSTLKTKKTVKKTAALKEITRDVVNKFVTFGDIQPALKSSGTSNPGNHNSPANESSPSSSQESAGTSSSVIFCGEVGEDGSLIKNLKRPYKVLDDIPISRADFVDGLNSIVRSLSNDSNLKSFEESPWRKRAQSQTFPKPVKDLPCNHQSAEKSLRSRSSDLSAKISPKRSLRYGTSSSLPQTCPRRSPRNEKKSSNLEKKTAKKEVIIPPNCYSASAALRNKKKFSVLTPENEDFLLLSQEPGDMPSIDEMVKMKKGAIKTNGKVITLSQIVRAYNGAAQGSSDLSNPCSSNSVASKDQTVPQFEDIVAEENGDELSSMEPARSCGSLCNSDSGSTRSSSSTRVLINGKYERDLYPISEVTDGELLSSDKADGKDPLSLVPEKPVEEEERGSSPVFIIKKAKFRRPMKKQTAVSKCASPASLPQTSHVKLNAISGMKMKSNEATPIINLPGCSSSEKKDCISPVDYINKLFLPKFLSRNLNQTPTIHERCKVLVEDTPEILVAPNFEAESIIIPPTPEGSEEDALLNESVTNSSVPQNKASLRVPLFSSRTGTTPQAGILKKRSNSTLSQNTPCEQRKVRCIESSLQVQDQFKTSENIENYHGLERTNVERSRRASNTSDEGAVSSLRNATRPRQSSVSKTQSDLSSKDTKETVRRFALSGFKTHQLSLVRRSPRNQEAVPEMPKKMRKNAHSYLKIDSSKEISESRKTIETRGKKIILKSDSSKEERETNQEKCFTFAGKREPGSESETTKSLEYRNSSNCSGSIKKNSSSESSSKSSNKELKLLSPPINGPPKKRSEIYEEDGSSNSPGMSGKQEYKLLNPEVFQGKKEQPSEKLEKKKESLPSLTDTIKRTSRLRSVESRSKSMSSFTLSEGDGNCLERKSSQEAKKRMAKSLTRSVLDPLKVIVCTFLTSSEQNGIEVAGEKLTGWKLEKKVTSRTTHVINSGPKRTVNMLKGMVRGCWLVNQNWMLDSSKNKSWLSEEKYELAQFSPAVQVCRLKRQAEGKEFKHKLFERLGPIYVSPKIEMPPAKDIRELLELCGADVRSSVKEAKIVVANDDDLRKNGVKYVKALWVLDSITKNKILPYS